MNDNGVSGEDKLFRVCPGCSEVFETRAEWLDKTVEAGSTTRLHRYVSQHNVRLACEIVIAIRKHECGGENYDYGVPGPDRRESTFGTAAAVAS